MTVSRYKKAGAQIVNPTDFSGLYIDPFVVSPKYSHKGAFVKRPPPCWGAPFSSGLEKAPQAAQLLTRVILE